MAKKSKNREAVPSLFVLRFESENRRQEIEKEFESSSWVGEVIENFQTRNTGRLYVALVVDAKGSVTHFCRLIRRIGSAGLNRVSVSLSEFEALTETCASTLVDVIRTSLSKKRAGENFTNLKRILPEENAKIIQALDIKDPDLATRLRQKGKADDRMLTAYTDHEKEILTLERDGLGLALEIAFQDREALVIDRVPKERIGGFLGLLSALGDDRFIEDEIVPFDKARFPGMEGLEFENPRTTVFRHRGSHLEIIHANRNALEHTLGVDLIYVSHYFKSFIGIQYKMLEGREGREQYSADDKFNAQLSKMEKFAGELESGLSDSHHKDHRLSSAPFFFKFVSRLEKNFADDALSPGMYIPFDLAKRVIAIPPHRIGYSCETRHLSNTEFANLFREGWIGSANDDLATLRMMIMSALGRKSSLLIAVDRRIEPKQRGNGRRRETGVKGLRA